MNFRRRFGLIRLSGSSYSTKITVQNLSDDLMSLQIAMSQVNIVY